MIPIAIRSLSHRSHHIDIGVVDFKLVLQLDQEMVVIRVFFLESKYKESKFTSVSISNNVKTLVFIIIDNLLDSLYFKMFI